MKNNKVFIIVVILAAVLASTITAYATSYLYAANEVSYDNTNSGISATNVQGAISELYDNAIDYNSMNTRVSTIESRYGSGTHYTSSDWIYITDTNSTEDRGLMIQDNSSKNRASFRYSSSTGRATLESRGSDGVFGSGTLELRGNPVMINGTNISSLIKSKMGCTSTSGLTSGKSVNTFLTVDSGYSFISYDSLCTSGGWASSFPIYIANAHDINQAKLYWNGTLSSGNVCCYLLEIKS